MRVARRRKQPLSEKKKKVGALPVKERKTLKRLLNKARDKGKADSRFDINLTEGEIAEEELRALFTGGVTIEVKRDFAVSKTGNVAIEESQRGKPSGITKTEAKVWAIVFDGPEYDGQVRVLIDTERLRCIVQDMKRYVYGGDKARRSRMRLLPVEWLLKPNSKLSCQKSKEKGKK